MSVERIRCTNCGAEFEEYDPKAAVIRCSREGCRALFIIPQAISFAKMQMDCDLNIQKLRGLMVRELQNKNADEMIRWSAEIQRLIPNDFHALFTKNLAYKFKGKYREYHRFLQDSHSGTITEESRDWALAIILDNFKIQDKEPIQIYIRLHYNESEQKQKEALLEEALQALRDKDELFADVPRDVFVCHSSSDSEIALEVYDRLKSDGTTCWISLRNLPPDTIYYWDKIKSAIRKCRIILVISSEQCMYREDPKTEMIYADECGLKRLEYKIDDSQHTIFFKHYFNGIQWVRGGYHDEAALLQLCERVFMLIYPEKVKETSTTESVPASMPTYLVIDNTVAGEEEPTVDAKKPADQDMGPVTHAAISKTASPDALESIPQVKTEQATEPETHAAAEPAAPDGMKLEEGQEERPIRHAITESYVSVDKEPSVPYTMLESDKPIFSIDERIFKDRSDQIEDLQKPDGVKSMQSARHTAPEKFPVKQDNVLSSDMNSNKEDKRPNKRGLVKYYFIGFILFCAFAAFKYSIALLLLFTFTIAFICKRVLSVRFSKKNKLAAIVVTKPESFTPTGDNNGGQAEDSGEFYENSRDKSDVIPPGKANYPTPALQAYIPDEKITASVNTAHKDGKRPRRRIIAWSIILSSLVILLVAYFVFPLASTGLTFTGDSTLTVTGYSGWKEDVVIPEEVNGKIVTDIGYRAFNENDRITSVSIPDSIKSIGNSAFRLCSNLICITIPEGVTSIGTGAFDGCHNLKTVYIPDTISNIGEFTFYRCNSLTDITLPDSITSIGAYAFSNCTNLTNITIPQGVVIIENNAFLDCDKLTISGYPGSIAETYAAGRNIPFKVVKGVTATHTPVPSVITDSTSITYTGDSTLTVTGYYGSEKEVVIPTEINGKKVIDIGSKAFFGSYITSITIPNSVTNIGTDAFLGCLGLKNVTIPNSVTNIGDGAFCSCNSLTNVTIPDSVMKIGYKALSSCSGLTNVTILPGCKTSIGEFAFSGCTNLASITIPQSVTNIAEFAFLGCINLTISGNPGSTAETYANKHNISFQSLLSVVSTQTPTPETDIQIPITIGAISPNTGNLATYGETVSNGIDLAVSKINAAGGVLGRRLEIIHMDDKCDATESANAFNKLVSNGVCAVIGSVTSGVTMGLGTLADAEGMLLLTPTATADSVTEGLKGVFQACYKDSFQGEVAAKLAVDLGVKQVAVLYASSDAYSTVLYDSFKTASEKFGLELVATESSSFISDTDYITQLTNIVNSGAELIFAPFYSDTVGPYIVPQARAAGFTGYFIGADGWDGTLDTMVEDKVLYNKCFFMNHFAPDDPSEIVQNFVKSYSDTYVTKSLNSLAALAYDSVFMLKQAIEIAGTDETSNIIEAMTSMTFFGVTGSFTLDRTGTPVKSVPIIEYVDGTAKFYKYI